MRSQKKMTPTLRENFSEMRLCCSLCCKSESFFAKSEGYFQESQGFFRRSGRLLPKSAGFIHTYISEKQCSFA